jgi:hypothetical protein
MFSTVGPDLPQDLFAATGGYAGALGWNVDRQFPRAAAWLENKFAPWAFSIVEDWAAGNFDDLNAVVFSRSDDTAHRLYYYIEELRRRGLLAGPEPLVFDVARIGRPSSVDHTVAAVRALAKRLDVNDAALERGIAATNARRAKTHPRPPQGPICLLAGSPPPDRRVHSFIEAAGWAAAGETLAEAWAALGANVVPNSGDPCAAVGRQLHAAQAGRRGFFDPAQALRAQVRATEAKAVVLWCTEEDETQVWHVPAQRRVLEEAGIPALVLTRCSWRADDGVDEKIAAFLKGITT